MSAPRFFARLSEPSPSGCWLWRGALQAGYGMCGAKRAHRVAWEKAHGPIPWGSFRVCVCHACDVKACVNPAHLWLGDRLDNELDRWLKRGFDLGVRLVYRDGGEAVPGLEVVPVALKYWSGDVSLAAFWRRFTINYEFSKEGWEERASIDSALALLGHESKRKGLVPVPPDRIHRNYRSYPRYFRLRDRYLMGVRPPPLRSPPLKPAPERLLTAAPT